MQISRNYLAQTSIILGLSGSLIGCSSSEVKPKTVPPIPVIASADVSNGLGSLWRSGPADIDDGFAIGMAQHDPGYDLKGVAATYGNSKVVEETEVAREIMGLLLGTSVPVFQGAVGKMGNPALGENQFGPLHPYSDRRCVNAGVQFMAQTLKANPGTVILATGPITDVACLAYHFPESHAAIKEVPVIMGRGKDETFELNGVTGLTDFNYSRDPEAVKYLLEETDIKMAFMTFSLTSSGFVPRSEIDDLRANPTAAAQFFYASSQKWLDQWASIFKEEGFHPWDQFAVYYPLNKGAYQCQSDYGFKIIPCEGFPKRDAKNNSCAGHGPGQPKSLNAEPSQLQFDQSFQSRPVTYCTAFTSDTTREAFMESLFKFISHEKPY